MMENCCSENREKMEDRGETDTDEYPLVKESHVLKDIPVRIAYHNIDFDPMDLVGVIMRNALPFLPAKSLCRFRTVSKGWNEWIQHPFFIHRQTHVFHDMSGLFCQVPGEKPFFTSLDTLDCGVPDPSLSFLPEPVTIRSSTNGLLCCRAIGGNEAYYICNPATKQWEVLPQPQLYHGPNSFVALAFEPSLYNFPANFELVCVVPLADDVEACFEIYSTRSRMWRIVDSMCCGADALRSDGFYMNKVAYWETSSGNVLAFDIVFEEYGLFPLPLCRSEEGILREMHGELCYVLPHKEGNNIMVDVYGNMNMSLKYRVCCDYQPDSSAGTMLRALPCGNDLQILLVGNNLFVYHINSNQEATVKRIMSVDELGTCLPYINSLVPVCSPNPLRSEGARVLVTEDLSVFAAFSA